MKLSDLITVADSEEREMLRNWLAQVNRTQQSYPRHRTVPQIFAARAKENPDAIAVVCGPIEVSYRGLAERTNRLASYLCTSGLEPGQLVAMLLPRSTAAIVAMLATLKAGGAYLPISPDIPPERVRRILAESRASVVIADEGGAALVQTLLSDLTPSPTLVTADRAGVRDAAAAARDRSQRARQSCLCDVHLRYDRRAQRCRGRASLNIAPRHQHQFHRAWSG
jgi:non-ribosomal peptide synthetase component F